MSHDECTANAIDLVLHLPAARRAAPARLPRAPPDCPASPPPLSLPAPSSHLLSRLLPTEALGSPASFHSPAPAEEEPEADAGSKTSSLTEGRGAGSRGRLKTSPPQTLYSASAANSLRSRRTEGPTVPESRPSPARGLATHMGAPQRRVASFRRPTARLRLAVKSSFSKHPERQISSDPGCAALIFPE